MAAEVQAVAAEAREKGIPEVFRKPLEYNDDDSSALCVPVVDMAAVLSGPAGKDGDKNEMLAAEEIGRACKEWGFVQLVNHGISKALMKRIRNLALDYFHLPADDRVVDWDNVIKTSFGNRDWVDSLLHFPKPYRPDATPRSKLPPGYKEALDQYVEKVLELVKRLQRVLSVQLGLNDKRLEEVMQELETVVRVNYYPPCPSPESVTGISAHADVGMLTVLLANDVEGLQVLKDGRWVTVKVVPDSLVINVADMLEIISNGAYVSCEHRAFVNSHSERLSVVVFVNTPGDLTLGPLPELVSESRPASYKPVSCNEHLAELTSKGLNGKATLRAKKISAADHRIQ